MNDELVREQRSGEGSVSPKTAPTAAAASMTLSSAALESNSTVVQSGGGVGAPMVSGHQATTSAGRAGAGAALDASSAQQPPQLHANDVREMRDIKQLLWGDNVREDVFRRWSQGKHYTTPAPTTHLPFLLKKRALFILTSRVYHIRAGTYICAYLRFPALISPIFFDLFLSKSYFYEINHSQL